MRISIKDHKNYVNLWDIDSGELFRPVNSQKVYMKLWNEMTDDIWNECESRLYDYYENPQNLDLTDISGDSRACVDMESGEIVLFHFNMRVVKLKYVLEVEG
jgi:hypothetical protein